MTSNKNLDLAQRLALRRGAPAAPTVTELVTEVRSNSIIAMPSPPPVPLDYIIGHMVIEWAFRLPLSKVREFNAFLADNEALIAQSCEKLMQGVHYRGTYMTTHGERLEYRTYWAYDSHEAHKQWEIGLRDPGSNFVTALRRLRSYWISDPDGVHRHFAPAALFAADPGGAFFKFTLETAEQMAGGIGPARPAPAPKPAARRKKKGRR
jgi:hypothetical protein